MVKALDSKKADLVKLSTFYYYDVLDDTDWLDAGRRRKGFGRVKVQSNRSIANNERFGSASRRRLNEASVGSPWGFSDSDARLIGRAHAFRAPWPRTARHS